MVRFDEIFDLLSFFSDPRITLSPNKYKLETVQDFFYQVGHQTTDASIENKYFFTK